MTTTSTRRRIVALALAIVLALTACSIGSGGGPDLIAAVDSVPGAVTTSVTPPTPDPLDGADRRYYFEGSVTAVADAIRNDAGEPGDSIDEDGTIYYLYRSGTVVVTDYGSATGVGLYDNERARNYFPILIASRGWNSTADGFRSSGSSSGNGFRGGGSGSGK